MDRMFIVEYQNFGTTSENIEVSYTVTDIAEKNTDTVYFSDDRTKSMLF